jgi:uncharacterized membrane protein YecN with MAPEG domain
MNTISFAIVGFYTGLNALILLWITMKTIALRAKYKVSVGDGGNNHLHRIMRGHSNALENIMIVLIMMVIMAVLGTPSYVLHGFGLALTISRMMHAYHFVQEDAARWQRYYGSVISVLLLLAAAVGVIGHSLVIMFS